MKRALKDAIAAVLLAVALGALIHIYAMKPDEHNVLSKHWMLTTAVAAGMAVAGAFLLRNVKTDPYLVTFEFVGGFMDGRSVTADVRTMAHAGRLDEALRYFVSTDRGKVGRRFWAGSEFAMTEMTAHGGDVAALKAATRDPRFQCAQYEIARREETDDEVQITAQYVTM